MRLGKATCRVLNNQIDSKSNIQALIADLKACSRTRNLKSGKQWHAEATERGHDSNIYIGNALIDMYAKCGSMVDARQVFDSHKHTDVVSWTALILGYAGNGQAYTALELFSRMRSGSTAPNSVTFVAAFKACISLAVEGARWAECKNMGKVLHNLALENGCADICVQSTLIVVYSKCGSMDYAHGVFDSMKHPDVVSWNVLILGYADNGQGYTALDLFTRMRSENVAPDSVTFVAALKACTSLTVNEGSSLDCRNIGREIHHLAKDNFCNVYVQNTLIDMYSKCGSMPDARQVFDSMKHRGVVSWNALISGYADNGQGKTALDLFSRMRTEGWAPNSVTFVASLKACTALAMKGDSRLAECREKAKEIHQFAVETGCDSDIYVLNTLADLYAKCGSMVEAHEVFESIKIPTVVSWNVLISGYADSRQEETALDLFVRMKTEGPTLNSVTVVAALKACASLGVKGRTAECRKRGKEIHDFAVKNGCISDIYVQNTLVDMYAKCGCMLSAREVFDNVNHLSSVSWTALILGYADNGQGVPALDIFTRMRSEGFTPDLITFGAAIKACGLVGALEFGRTLHVEINSGKELDLVLVTCLVDFYAKCGSLMEAQNVFDSHSGTRDVITWTALLAGFSSCGDSEAVFRLFETMQDASVRPDSITFLCILTCCSHAGLVEKGKACFDSIFTRYGIVPTVEHYNCMIDIFGRANKLDDAMALLEQMPCNPNEVTWMTVLSACHKLKNVEIGRLAFQSLVTLNERESAAYVLMGDIYGSKGMLEEQEMMIFGRKSKAWKEKGQTCWTNEVGEVHIFFNDDNVHPQSHEIRAKWKSMTVVMTQHGYVPHENEEVCGHSERMALVCALVNTEPGKTITIVKDLRVCEDCHNAITLVSKLEQRTIICRDKSRIHVFKDGKCSCVDPRVQRLFIA